MLLPFHVVIIPQYILFNSMGMVNTFLPLLAPKFLATEAFFVFLMVQFLRGLPRELDEAARIAASGAATILAGGTDLMPNMKHRLFTPNRVIGLKQIAELKGIHVVADELHIGSAETLTAISRNPLVREHAPAFARAAGLVAGPQLRNMIGGQPGLISFEENFCRDKQAGAPNGPSASRCWRSTGARGPASPCSRRTVTGYRRCRPTSTPSPASPCGSRTITSAHR